MIPIRDHLMLYFLVTSGVFLPSGLAGPLDLPGTQIFQQESSTSHQNAKKTSVVEDLNSNNPKKQDENKEGVASLNHRSKPPQKTNVGNTSTHFMEKNQSELRSVVVLPQVQDQRLFSLRAGDEFEVEILHSVIAFSDERAPVVGRIASGAFRGAKILGSSRLEKNSKRVFIDFSRISLKDSEYEITSLALTQQGQAGFVGEYHSRETEYFGGEFLAAMTAAFFDGQIPKYTNFFGQKQEDHSVDSAFKKGLAAGAMSTADLFKEKLKKVPEFSEIRGPFRAKILIQDGNRRVQ